jgi:hypothetical protein
MDIDARSLTTCEIAPDGEAIHLGFVDSEGRSRTVRFSLNQVGALAMTLPAALEKALHARYGDSSLRYAYPLESWAIEQSSDPTMRMVTLRTTDGYSVCFTFAAEQQSRLGEALSANYEQKILLAN